MHLRPNNSEQLLTVVSHSIKGEVMSLVDVKVVTHTFVHTLFLNDTGHVKKKIAQSALLTLKPSRSTCIPDTDLNI